MKKILSFVIALAVMVSMFVVPSMAYGSDYFAVYQNVGHNGSNEYVFWFDCQEFTQVANGAAFRGDPYVGYLRDYSTPKALSGNDSDGPFWGVDGSNVYVNMNSQTRWTNDHCINNAYTFTIDVQLANANVANKFAGIRMYTTVDSDAYDISASSLTPGNSGLSFNVNVADDTKDQLIISAMSADKTATSAAIDLAEGTFASWATLKIVDDFVGNMVVCINNEIVAELTISGSSVVIADADGNEVASTTNANLYSLSNFNVVNVNDGDLYIDNVGVKAYSEDDIPVATEAPATEAPATEAPATEAPATEAPATEAPATEAPATEAPATEAPATEAPATEAPATEAPATEAPATEAPATEAPATDAPATDAPIAEMGDVNTNGVVDAKDVTVLRRVIATGFEVSEYNAIYADLNGDGRINSMDVTLLRRLISDGWSNSEIVEVKDQNELKDAISNSDSGDTIILDNGSYELGNDIPDGLIIVGNGDTVITDAPVIDAENVTVENVVFDSEEGASAIISGSGEFKDCTFEGESGLYQSQVSDTVVFDGCTFKGDIYGAHFEGSGEVIFKNCVISGWTSFASNVKVYMENCIFEEHAVTEYNNLRFYADAEVVNCVFNKLMNINAMNGVTVTLTGCSVDDEELTIKDIALFFDSITDEAYIIDGELVTE